MIQNILNKPFLFKYFDDTAEILLKQYKRGALLSSSSNKGKTRELFCSDFLSRVLPPKLSIRSGEIWDSFGNKTGQLDIIIIRDDIPALDFGGKCVYLAESVFGVIEVKSFLNKKELMRAGKGLEKVRELSVREKAGSGFGYMMDHPLRIIFSYDGMKWNTIGKHLNVQRWNQLFDLICILKSGVMIAKGGLIKLDTNEIFHIVNGSAAALGVFYYYLISYASSYVARWMDLEGYFKPLENWES